MVKTIHDRKKCIGCGSCALICPKLWKMNPDGKADLTGGEEKEGLIAKETGDSEESLEAAQSCPVNAIHIEKEGKKIV